MRALLLALIVCLSTTSTTSAASSPPPTESCQRRDARYAARGPWNIDLNLGAALLGGSSEIVLRPMVTRTLFTHLKLGAGFAGHLGEGLSGLFGQVLVGLRFALSARVTLDLDWRFGYGGYWIDNSVVPDVWADAFLLAPSVSGRFALSPKLEVFVAPFAIITLISNDNGFVSTSIDPYVGLSWRF